MGFIVNFTAKEIVQDELRDYFLDLQKYTHMVHVYGFDLLIKKNIHMYNSWDVELFVYHQ